MSELNFISSSRIAVVGLELMGGSLAFALGGRCQAAREIPVPGGLARCIRVLLQWNTDLPQQEIRHVYLGAASNLRPDLNVTDISK